MTKNEEKKHTAFLMKTYGWTKGIAAYAMDYYMGRMPIEDLKYRAGKYADEIIRVR